MKNDRVEVVDDFQTDSVSTYLNGSLVKKYDAVEVSDVYGMDIMVNDLREYCHANDIELSEDLELVLIRR